MAGVHRIPSTQSDNNFIDHSSRKVEYPANVAIFVILKLYSPTKNTMPEFQYYLHESNETTGPHSLEELKDSIESGLLEAKKEAVGKIKKKEERNKELDGEQKKCES